MSECVAWPGYNALLSTRNMLGKTCVPAFNTTFLGGRWGQMWARASSFLRFIDQKRHTTVGRTPLDEWKVRRRDLYLTTHNTHNRQTSMPQEVFEPTISAGKRLQTYAEDRAATWTGVEGDTDTQAWGWLSMCQVTLPLPISQTLPNTGFSTSILTQTFSDFCLYTVQVLASMSRVLPVIFSLAHIAADLCGDPYTEQCPTDC